MPSIVDCAGWHWNDVKRNLVVTSNSSDTTKIVVDGTQIKGEAVADLLDMLEEGEGDALEGKSLPEDMELPTSPKERQAMLERLVRESSSWQARRVAARLLAQSDEMRVVPSLIYALDDPDTSVRSYARDGLRFISRKFEGFADWDGDHSRRGPGLRRAS